MTSALSRCVVGRNYNLMYRCMYDLVKPRCGSKAALLHVTYSIKLWQPAMIAFFCDLGRSTLSSPVCPDYR